MFDIYYCVPYNMSYTYRVHGTREPALVLFHITTCLTAYNYWQTRARVPYSSCTCPWHRVTYNFEPRAFLFLLNPFLTLSLSVSFFYIHSLTPLTLVHEHTCKLAEIGWTEWVSGRLTMPGSEKSEKLSS